MDSNSLVSFCRVEWWCDETQQTHVTFVADSNYMGSLESPRSKRTRDRKQNIFKMPSPGSGSGSSPPTNTGKKKRKRSKSGPQVVKNIKLTKNGVTISSKKKKRWSSLLSSVDVTLMSVWTETKVGSWISDHACNYSYQARWTQADYQMIPIMSPSRCCLCFNLFLLWF